MASKNSNEGQASMLGRGAGGRIMLALGLAALLWTGVLWALG
jgi:hypothetical protein